MPKRATKRASRAKSSRKLIELIKAYRQKRAVGARYYAASDQLMQELVRVLTPGRRVPLDGGVFAVLVDPFANDQQKAFRPVFLSRWELKIVDANGVETRLRDRARARGPVSPRPAGRVSERRAHVKKRRAA